MLRWPDLPLKMASIGFTIFIGLPVKMARLEILDSALGGWCCHLQANIKIIRHVKNIIIMREGGREKEMVDDKEYVL